MLLNTQISYCLNMFNIDFVNDGDITDHSANHVSDETDDVSDEEMDYGLRINNGRHVFIHTEGLGPDRLGEMPGTPPMDQQPRIKMKMTLKIVDYALGLDKKKIIYHSQLDDWCTKKLRSAWASPLVIQSRNKLFTKISCCYLSCATVFCDELMNHNYHMWSYLCRETDNDPPLWNDNNWWHFYWSTTIYN